MDQADCPNQPQQTSYLNQIDQIDKYHEPLPQLAQKCPYCYQYLLINQDTTYYIGNNPDFRGWICHSLCAEIDIKKNKELEYFIENNIKRILQTLMSKKEYVIESQHIWVWNEYSVELLKLLNSSIRDTSYMINYNNIKNKLYCK